MTDVKRLRELADDLLHARIDDLTGAGEAILALLTALDEAQAENARLRDELKQALGWIESWRCFVDDPEFEKVRHYINQALEVKT